MKKSNKNGTKQPLFIAPSMLASDLSRLADEVKSLEKAGADVLHFDVMDGHFVPNITFGLPVIESIRKHTKLPIDAHLMIDDADKYLEDFQKVGADWISVHVEACPHLNRTLARIRELGMKAGVAINPGTALSAIDGVLDSLDFVLIMSVNPGFGGQKFIPSALSRVRALKEKIGNANVRIQIDGGIKKDNIAEVVAAGADVIVMGTGLFSLKDYAKAIPEIKATALRK